ncbi:MAG TPA: tetratricopeptide repeat protein [Acidobacteriaceae bacterium]|nr:tetratricopeptide repeat protein [Acidobacteriaceae bacterium]
MKTACALILLALACPGRSQTYQVGPNNSVKQQNQNGQPQGQQLGWGSSIQNARLARAAELALERGDHALALQYAQRAAEAAPNNAQIWFLLGYAARLDGKYGQSVDAYNKGLRLDPSSLDAQSGLAQTYSMMGRSNEAETLLKKIVATNPGRGDDLLLLGNMYLQSRDYNDALDTLTKAERAAPGARAELLLAITCESLHQMSMASHYLDMAKRRSPNNPDVERSLAGYYRSSGDYGKAIDELKAIHNPSPDVVAETAYTYQLDGKPEEAAQLYDRAADARPHDLNLQLSAAQAQMAAGSVGKADPFLARAAQIDPNSYRLHAIRGDIDKMQDRDQDAVTEYAAAVAHLPAAPQEGPLYGIQLHMDLQELYRNLNQTDQSQQQLQAAQSEISALNEQGADRAAFLRLRALIRMDEGQEDSALADMKESLALSPHDPNSLQIDGDLLMKMGRTQDAIDVYQKELALVPRSRYALTSLGYAERAAGNVHEAEKYFTELAQADPHLYVPYLGLGDLYTAIGQDKKAESLYAKGYAVAPGNALIVAGGMNAAIEGHDLPLAGVWLHRVTDNMTDVPQVLREEERYYNFEGDYEKSADLGERAIKDLPHDRDVVVYLGYDLLHLERYAELQALMQRDMDSFPKEPDVPLLAGYVYKHDGKQNEAVAAFTEALKRDPRVETAYVNRGFVRNDMHQPDLAAGDFQAALKEDSKDGEAHLGLAFAELNLHHPGEAVRQAQAAQNILGDGEVFHTIRATAYGREGLLTRAADEYRAALRFDPKDGSLYLGLANIYFGERRYREALDQLLIGQRYLPDKPEVYALMARVYANLGDRDPAMHDIRIAEQLAASGPAATRETGSPLSDIYLSTGQALSTLGDQKAAMERFSKALTAPWSNRVDVRLAIAHTMEEQGHTTEAQRQIALAQMEAATGTTQPPTGQQYIEAADILQQMHEYQLSQYYLSRAQIAGASDTAVRVARANNYLALGDTTRAAAELAAVSSSDGSRSDYGYLMAEASVYQQEHRGTKALSAFAAAASAAGDDQTAEQSLLLASANEGYRVTPQLSVLTNAVVQPVFEDSTVYVLDSKLDSPSGPVAPSNTAQLPPPRSSSETDWISAYHLHLGSLPTAGGFFQYRNARGLISVPATNSIVNRDTNDYIFNFGVAPTVRIGSNVLTFNSGVQETIRRDSRSPVEMNQNLFRVFTYLTTSSFFNAVSADGYFVRELGPFTETPIFSHALTGAIDFRVGAPWSRTALITGWGSTDQTFPSAHFGNSENYFTSSYIGLTRRFGTHLNIEAIAEDLRTWRIVPFSPLHSAIAQALRPAGTIDYSPSRNWEIQATTAYEDTRGFHVYDMTTNGLSVSYIRPFGRRFNDETGEVHLRYPLRFSAGVQEETFPNFSAGTNQQFKPYFSITLF